MKYNIAICGTFNVDNYGDVMFPEIFKRAMHKRGLDFELFLISPGNTTDKTLAPDAKVYSVSEMDNIHQQNPLDAIIIGGGALIHYNKIPVKLPDEDDFSEYNIYDSWYTPIEFAVRNNIKVLFNLPQIPYVFPETLKEVTKKAFDWADYISLRDNTSAKYLEEIYDCNQKPQITVCPDSVCSVHELIPKEELSQLRKQLLPFEDKYIVVQFNAQKDHNDGFEKIIDRLKSENYKIVLLPLGYTHNDDVVLNEYNHANGEFAYIIDKKLDIFEMTAVLSDCSIYIGSSFHGAIVSTCYGNTAISYNYIFPKTKNAEIYGMYGVNDFISENAEGVYDILDKYLNEDIKFKPDVQKVLSQVNAHFDNIYNLINDISVTQKYNNNEFYYPLIELLPQNVKLTEQSINMKQTMEMTVNHVNNLESFLKQKDNEISQKCKEIVEKDAIITKLQHGIDEYKEKIDEYKEKYEEANGNYLLISNSYNEVMNSFFWRVTLPVRKTSHSLKIFLTKHKKLLEIAIFTKGFLKRGLSGGKQALANYRRLFDVDKKLTLELPKKVFKFQRRYKFSKDITFSILVPLYNTPMDFLEQMIESVKKQTYKKWELCLADGSDGQHSYVKDYCLNAAQRDSRIKYSKLVENRGISENTNECLKMATGDYIALFDHDDILEPTVLFEYMKVICEQNADFIYCDEDKFNEFGGELYDANYKPDFAIDNLRSNNYICHFTVFDKSLIKKSGAFRKEFDGSQDHDLILRLTEQAKNIVHIPKVLYHWRVSNASVASDPYAKPYTIEAGKKAVAQHLERSGLKGKVESTLIHPNIYRIKYDIIGNPLVSIIIPNYNHVEELSRCIDSIINKSTYKNYEIIIVENNSDEETFKYYDTLKKYDNITVVVYKTENEFNYSAINNYGVRFAKGEHYILLNNDIEIITPEWIEEMLMYSQRDDVGAVGAMLYYPNDTIQHAGVTLGVLTLAGHNFKHSPRGNCGYFGRAGYQHNVSAVTAACLMLPAKVYKEVNGLDESFAVSFNDIDFCMRIRQAGHLIVFTPFAELYHYESISRGDDESPEKRTRFVSEVERFQKRWKKELEAGDPYYNPNLTLDREDFSPKQ